jgi:pyrroloquinoline quinone biosynthesis protein E
VTRDRPEPPLALVAELTHRCPLQCPYCANPVALGRSGGELDTATWRRVLDEAASLGVLQLHFSGGEPTVRSDLDVLVRHAAGLGMYSNLITSGVLLDAARLRLLAEAGLDHIQLSFQDADPGNADRIGGLAGGHAGKLAVARQLRAAGLPLTVNFVVHRQNLERVPDMIGLGEALDAGRIEIAHVQYYGWALMNRDALLPTRAQLDAATDAVEAARARLRGRMVIDYVVPDYYAERPKACMGGWGRRIITVTPAGKALPCHAAEGLPGLAFPCVRETTLAAIWQDSPAFVRFRGTGWMAEPCRSCDQRETDWGGCRCQAFTLTGDAARTDPACAKAPDHAMMNAATAASALPPPAFVYRRYRSPSEPASTVGALPQTPAGGFAPCTPTRGSAPGPVI